MATPRLVVAGNCQARFIANILQATPAVSERYKIVYFRNFRKGDQGVLDEKTVRLCDVWLEQIAHNAPELPHRSLLPKWAKTIRFPIVWMNSLWPSYSRDPRNPPKSEAAPLWAYGDRVILDAIGKGATPEEAAQRWFDTDISKSLDLDRFHQINASKALALDTRADIKLGAYGLENFRRERLFVTHNHPSFRMLEVMRDKVFDALDLPPSDFDVRPSSGGMYHTHVPVHPTVASHFGLEWYDPEARARVRNVELPVREYFRRYAAWEAPPNPEGVGLDLDTE